MTASERKREQAVAQFRFEPRGLWRHDAAGVGDLDDVAHAHRMHGKADGRIATTDHPLEGVSSACTANKVNALVPRDIADAEQRAENQIVQQAHIKTPVRTCNRVERQLIPAILHEDRYRAPSSGHRGTFSCTEPQSQQLSERRGVVGPEIEDDAVVWKDSHLVSRERHCQKVVASSNLPARTGGTCRAVMAV